MHTPRTVLITGVSRGLGRAMALGFASRGYRVLGCARNPHIITDLAEELGKPHAFAVVDVADDQAVADYAESVLREREAPDLLINSAALINRNAPLWEIDAKEFDHVLKVNVSGVANMIRHFLPGMIRRNSGVVLNFSSGWGRSTSPEVAPYCATKWAIEGLTQALAQELPRGMAAIAVNPGIIDTDMLRSSFGSSAASYPSPASWAEKSVSFLEQLGPKDNGRSVTCPS